MRARRILTLIEELQKELQAALENRDEFGAFFLRSRRELREAAIDDSKHARRQRMIIESSYRLAADYGFRGTPEQWRALLDIGITPTRVNSRPSN